MRREREEELWNTHEEHRAEIQQDLEKVARMKEETQAQKDKAEAEIEYARECLQKEREACKYAQAHHSNCGVHISLMNTRLGVSPFDCRM